MPGARGSGGHGRSGPAKKGANAGLQDAIADCTPPEGMTAAALAYWSHYAPLQVERGLLTRSSRDVLRNYCEALALRDRLTEALADMPMGFLVPMVDTETGTQSDAIKANPLISALKGVRLECRQHANDLCLAPAAAIRMPALGEPEQDELDGWQGGKALRAIK